MIPGHDLPAPGLLDPRLREASMLHRQGRNREAVELFRVALAQSPAPAEIWYEFGYLLRTVGDFTGALDAYGQALARGVSRPEEAHLNRAVIYSDRLRRDEEAAQELDKALALAPNYVPALLNRGNLHEERGERELALAYYKRLLALAPDPGSEYHDLHFEALARSVHLEPPASVDDPVFRQLQRASAAVGAQTSMVRANLQFATGKAYEKLGAYDAAFDAFAKANRALLRQAKRPYDPPRFEHFISALIESFSSPSTMVSRGASPADGADPLFICGMFRSGSTLVEQILAGHPRVTPGGELDYLMHLAAAGPLAPYPASMRVANPERDRKLADDYRAHLAQLFPNADPNGYISDKRPDNFLLIGLIKRMFPEAKIVHTSRHPLDNGLSIYMQHLNPPVAPYSCDLDDIGHYYGQYRRLMAHWKTQYPESIYDFDYDAFVAAPKTTLEPLFEFLGLEWDDRYLEFHRLGNTVKTASYWQVRKPLYGDASGRWRHYRKHLGPLVQALQDAGVSVDASL
jgi:tetratricopeptide (TPR) repeat protein